MSLKQKVGLTHELEKLKHPEDQRGFMGYRLDSEIRTSQVYVNFKSSLNLYN